MEKAELKKRLFEKGFISFKLEEFDKKLYDNLYSIFPKNYLVPKFFTNLRHSVKKNNFEYPENIVDKSFEELNEIKKYIISKFNKVNECDQVWFYASPESYMKNDYLQTLINPIFKEFYDFTLSKTNSQITLYNDGCYLKNHSDGKSINRSCVILIYLSEGYKNGYGGELSLGSDKNMELVVEPEYGNVAIFDFTKHDIWHSVKPVSGYNRYCFINFC